MSRPAKDASGSYSATDRPLPLDPLTYTSTGPLLRLLCPYHTRCLCSCNFTQRDASGSSFGAYRTDGQHLRSMPSHTGCHTKQQFNFATQLATLPGALPGEDNVPYCNDSSSSPLLFYRMILSSDMGTFLFASDARCSPPWRHGQSEWDIMGESYTCTL